MQIIQSQSPTVVCSLLQMTIHFYCLQCLLILTISPVKFCYQLMHCSGTKTRSTVSPEEWTSRMLPVSSTLISPHLWSPTFTGLEGGARCYSLVFAVHFGIRDFFFTSSLVFAVFPPCRTARADNPGTALSFISHTELGLLAEVDQALAGGQEVHSTPDCFVFVCAKACSRLILWSVLT